MPKLAHLSPMLFFWETPVTHALACYQSEIDFAAVWKELVHGLCCEVSNQSKSILRTFNLTKTALNPIKKSGNTEKKREQNTDTRDNSSSSYKVVDPSKGISRRAGPRA